MTKFSILLKYFLFRNRFLDKNIQYGNVYLSGERLEKQTSTVAVQQYSYLYALGVSIGVKYQLLGPLFTRINLDWTPLQWQKGKVVDLQKNVVNMKELFSPRVVPRVGLELGYRFDLGRQVQLDLGARYTPNVTSFKLSDTDINTQSIGGQVRMIYLMK